MNIVKVVNIKCGGCAKGIRSALEEKRATNVSVDIENQKVSFEGEVDLEEIKRTLAGMGYPESGSEEAESFFKKAKSYISCAIGKTK